MSATIINFRAQEPHVARSARIKSRLAAVERHRSAMAAYRESSKLATFDPIFVAIDAHCMAASAYHAAGDDDASAAAMDLEGKALGILLDSRAITMTGLVALLEHLGQPEFLIYDDQPDETVFSGAIEYLDQARTFPLKLADMVRNAIGMVPSPV